MEKEYTQKEREEYLCRKFHRLTKLNLFLATILFGIVFINLTIKLLFFNVDGTIYPWFFTLFSLSIFLVLFLVDGGKK